MSAPPSTTRPTRKPSISPLSATDGYVYDRGSMSWAELAELLPRLHAELFGIDADGLTTQFRHASAPAMGRTMVSPRRTGYNLIPR